MIALPPPQRLMLVVVASVLGIAASWFAMTPFGMLAPITALFVYARGGTVWLIHAALGIGFAASVVATIYYTGDSHGRNLSWPAFFVVALCIGSIVSIAISASALGAAPEAPRASVNKKVLEGTSETLEKSGAIDEPGSRSLLHPDDRPAWAQAAAYAFWTGVPQVRSFRKAQPDGSFRWTDLRVEPGYDVSVDTEAMVSSAEGRWTHSGSLGETVEAVRAAKVIESLYGKAWAFDAGGQFTYVTPAAQAAIGMTLEDLNAPVSGGDFIDGGDTGWSRGVHPDDYGHAAATLRNCLKTGEHWHIEYRMLRATGAYVWHRIAARPTRDSQGRITGWYGTSIDIDVYKRTEAALRDRERALTQLVNMVPSFLWRLTPEGDPNFFNRRLIDFLGLDAADVDKLGSSPLASLIETIAHPDDVARLREALEHCIDTGERFSLKYRLRRADGVYRWVEGAAEPLRDESGRILQWFGLSNDIDDQMRAEEILRERERSLRQLVETLPAMIDCASPDGEPIYRSQQLREFLGYSLESLDGVGKTRLSGTLDAGIHPEDLPGVKEKYAHSLSTGEPYARKHRLRRFDGEYRWVETRAAAMRNSEGAIVQWNVICLDIESEVRAQEELRLARERLARASQAASLAELSASIAHEVNQPLTAIVANSHACHRWLSADPPAIERAKNTAEYIVHDANSAADVVSRIRALFKQNSDVRSSAALGSVIAEVRDLMAEEARHAGVVIMAQVDGEIPIVAIDRVQIQQVLINLIRNGIEAMTSVAGDRILQIRARRAGETVQTEISDQGLGVEFPDRMFEPFHTTKKDGMGMGLSICRSIVEAHGGRLWAEKNEASGLTLAFTIPFNLKVAQ